MARREKPLDPADGALGRFAAGSRRLRADARSPAYRTLAQRAYYSAAVLSQAASGRTVPSLPVVTAYVRAGGGDVGEWTRWWHRLCDKLTEERRRSGAAARRSISDMSDFDSGVARHNGHSLRGDHRPSVARRTLSGRVRARGFGRELEPMPERSAP